MAKRNILLGTASGKLGDIVFSRRNGEQIISTRVTPANPKSEAQSRQRMAFATATSAASRLRQIIDHSFEGIKYGQDSVNYFVKLNLKALRAAAAYNGEELPEGSYNDFLIKGVKGVARMPFVVSEGRLNFPNGELVTTAAGVGIAINVTNDGLWSDPISDASIYEAVLSQLHVVPGDQLTLLAVVTDGSSAGVYDPTGAYNTTSYVEFARIIFKKVSEIDWASITAQPLLDAVGGINAQFVNFERSSEWVGNVLMPLGVDGNGGNTAVFVPIISNPVLVLKMAAVIRSQRGENGWLRSSNKFAVADDQNATADMVWPSYASQSAELVSDRYLNQATNNVGSTGTSQVAKAPFILSFNVAKSGSALNITDVRAHNIPSSTVMNVVVYDANDEQIQTATSTIGSPSTLIALTDDIVSQRVRIVVSAYGVSRTQYYNWVGE